MREQASATLKALNEARVALEAEARGHLATQSQLLELHQVLQRERAGKGGALTLINPIPNPNPDQVLQKEREFYVLEMQALHLPYISAYLPISPHIYVLEMPAL